MSRTDPDINAILHAVADPSRKRILQELKEAARSLNNRRGLCASDIESRLGLSQPTISHHMAILQESGLVSSTRIGQWRLYRRNETVLRAFFKKLKREL